MSDCQICMEEFESESSDLVRHCEGRHIFCRTCFDEWRVASCRRDDSVCVCPICRSPIQISREIIQYYDSGQILSICGYLGNAWHGTHKIWHSNGNLYEESHYVHNKKEGLFKTWHSNGGRKEECTYVNGKKEGLYQSWYESGQINIICSYQNGILHGPYRKWWNTDSSNPHLEKECSYDMGMGIARTWHRCGTLHQEYREEDGQWEGPYQSWYKNGQIASKGIYRAGIRDGIFWDWTPEGTQITHHYIKGKTTKELFQYIDDTFSLESD